MKILQTPQYYNYKNNLQLQQNRTTNSVAVNYDSVSFSGKPDVVKPNLIRTAILDPLENFFATVGVKFIQTKPMQKLVEKIEEKQAHKNALNAQIDVVNKGIAAFNENLSDKSKKLKLVKKYNDNLYSHLIVIGSTVLSGFYVLKTLENKKMDEDKRRTLAINQGLVYVVSTVMAYTFDHWINKKVSGPLKEYSKYNNQENEKNLKALYEQLKENLPEDKYRTLVDESKLVLDNNAITELEGAIKQSLSIEKQKLLSKTQSAIRSQEYLAGLDSGAKKAKSIMAVDMVYRFIAPVLVTPFANIIGNRLQGKKDPDFAFNVHHKQS